jgi:hypothetical protein
VKILLRTYLCITVYISTLTLANAQFYNTGQAPSSIRWMQIKTENFQIIYPSGFFKEANRAANLLEYVYTYSSKDYTKEPKRISVILYNQSVRSNGYVVWAPKRAEWITTPTRDTYVQDWLEQLALHEYRHVVQISNLEQGLTKVLNIVFGQMITGVVAAYLPFWFLEGDAVVNETALSSTGRGRSPDFNLELRTMEMEKDKRYSYDQSYLGSYKYFVPDYYKYGYQMVSYAKLKYDNNIWRKTIDKVGKNPYLGAPFYFGLKKNGVKSKVKLYHESLDSLSLLWKKEVEKYTPTQADHFNIPKTKHYTNYKYVQYTPYGIFAVKTSIDDITRFVFFSDSSESVIHTPGKYDNTKVCAGQKYAVWTEYQSHVRWQQKDYSVIKLLELANGNEKQLTNRSRLFSPALSADDEKIACIKIDEQNQYSIIILNSFNGEIEKELNVPVGVQIFQPVWLNEEILAFISMSANSKKIEQLTITTGEKKIIFQSGLININNLHANDSILYFSCDLEMARNIFALDIYSDEVLKVTSSKYGADFPFVKDDILFYSDYTINGYMPVKIDLKSSKHKAFHEIKKYNYAWADSLSRRAGTNIQKDSVQMTNYDSSKYNRLLNSFYFHSWTPFYFDVNDILSMNPEIFPGITLLSQNKLSTVTSSISYYYTDQTHYIRPKITIERFFPVFELSGLFGSHSRFLYQPENVPPPDKINSFYDINFRCYLGINLTRNKYSRYLQPSISYGYTNEHYYFTPENSYKRGYDYFGASIYFSNLQKKSSRDIYSRFGQTISLSMNIPMMDPTSFSGTHVGAMNLFFPGIFHHHSIRLYLAGENKDIKLYARGNNISLPRGYLESFTYSSMIRGSVEYTFPIFYPDWSIGPLVYIKRFHTSIFYDAAKLSNLRSNDTNLIASTGITLASEMHFLRFFVPFTPKINFAYLPNENSITITYGISIDSSIF